MNNNQQSIATMKTRKDYMDGKCTHQEYYAQFVTPEVTSSVLQRIGKTSILKSKDESFNDIQLSKWDALQQSIAPLIANTMKECGDFVTLSGVVCTAKAAARIIQDENK